MHAEEREKLIINAVSRTGFVTYRDLEAQLDASPATIRRDLTRLEEEGQIERVHGGAKLAGEDRHSTLRPRLTGTPFDKALDQSIAAKRAIGEAAARLCQPHEGVIIDGGTTTFQMCPHLAELRLQVLTNSLHIVNALLPQEGTQILVPSGTIFREQNIVLAPSGEVSMPNFHASKLFLGAAAVSPRGIFQTDAILVASQRRLLELADEVILVVDSTKLETTSGAIVCELKSIDRMITDRGANPERLAAIRTAGLEVIVVD
jgi:DeoR family ulaG and ulaABCDEF operon transcriptional repressor